MDFFGCNCYNRIVVSSQASEIKRSMDRNGGNFSGNRCGILPEILYTMRLKFFLRTLSLKYRFILLKMAYIMRKKVGNDGIVHDAYRIQYVEGFLKWIHKAIAEGADIRGYYLWSLYDNFEWNAGYTYPFGIVHTDFVTQKRTWKDSAHWYQNVIKNNGLKD